MNRQDTLEYLAWEKPQLSENEFTSEVLGFFVRGLITEQDKEQLCPELLAQA